MQAKISDLESQVSESDTTRAQDALPKAAESTIESSSVTKKLEEELKKRDALIEVRLFLTLDCILIGVHTFWLNH